MQVPVRHLHHSPEYWEQPEEFIPERLEERERGDIMANCF